MRRCEAILCGPYVIPNGGEKGGKATIEGQRGMKPKHEMKNLTLEK